MEQLRANETAKIEELFSIYSKTEGSFLKFPELVHILLEKRFFSNKITVDKIVPLYQEAVAFVIEVKEI
jgi:hypothetical protein